MKKFNKKNSLKAPNYAAALFAAIIILMCILFVTTEIDIYDTIVTQRNSIADSMKTGSLDIEAIQNGYEACVRDMENLKNKSQLGNVLATLDETAMGQVAAWMLLRIVRIGMVGLAIFILIEVWKMIKIVCFNIKKKRNEAKLEKVASQNEEVA